MINIRKSKADKVLPGVDKVILDINNSMSAHLPSSEISAINNNAGIKAVKVGNDTFEVIKKSIAYSKVTNGKFDITIGPIVKLWGISTEKQKLKMY